MESQRNGKNGGKEPDNTNYLPWSHSIPGEKKNTQEDKRRGKKKRKTDPWGKKKGEGKYLDVRRKV